jgi:hypothetical protein
MKNKQAQKSTFLTTLNEGRWGWFLPVVGVIVVAAIRLLQRDSEMLLRAQELNLWLPTGLFWKTLMQYPGGAAAWLATYLTQ